VVVHESWGLIEHAFLKACKLKERGRAAVMQL
jgi:hypothetical protein